MLGIDSQVARATWTVLLIGVVCLLVYAIRHTLFLFVVALLFAYLLLPLVDFIDRKLPMRRSRTPALAIVYLLLVGGIGLAGFEIGAVVARQANALTQHVTDFLKPEQTQDLPLPQPFKPLGDRILSAVRAAIQDHYQQIMQALPQAAFQAMNVAAGTLVLVIVPILSFFFLKDGRALQRYFVSQVDDSVHRDAMREFAKDLNVLLAQYMRALVLLGLAAAIAYGAFFSIIGMPYAILLAVIAFPLEFIPMLGPLTACVIIVLVATFSGFHHLLAILAFLIVYRLFQDYVLAPFLMSAGMELHPLLVIFGVFAGEQIAGVAGAFLSVPTMAVLRLLYRRLERASVRHDLAQPEIMEAK